MQARYWSLLFVLLLVVPAFADPEVITLAADPPTTRTASLEEVWRLGGEDDEDILMGVVSNAALGPEGETYLVDRQLSQVLVVSADGETVVTLGREGEGPGELTRPHSVVVMDEGKIGVVQGFPGKIILLNADDTPGGEVTIGGGAEDGGFNFCREVFRSDDHLIAASGRATFDMNSGKSVTVNTLAVMDLQGVEQAVIVEHEQESDLQRRVYDEVAEFSEMDQWTVGPDGVIYTTPELGGYAINLRNLQGDLLKTYRRDFQPRKREPEDKEQITNGMVIVMNGRRVEIESKVQDTDPPIMGLDAAADGRLFVTNCYGQEDHLPEGTAAIYDVFSPEGRWVEELTLTIPGFKGDRDRLAFLDGEHFLVIKYHDQAQDAMDAGFGGGEDEEEEEESYDDAQPLEVILVKVS